MAGLSLQSLSKRFGAFRAVDAVSLDVAQGEFVSLLGPSGCGKTTVLRMIAGLLEPDSGRLFLDGADVTYLPPHKRNVGLVFQSYALFPHMSVFENVAFGLRRRAIADADVQARARQALAMVRLGNLGDRFPAQLSGGQQQRVALARAIAPRPTLLLLDEPLSNLDAQLRESMQVELKRLQSELALTTIFVTHDQSEALALSDRVCVLNQGVLQQVGRPDEIYHHPANGFVAGFLGRSNRLRGRVAERSADGATVALAEGPLVRIGHTTAGVGEPVELTIRQESIRLLAGADAALANIFQGRIAYRAFTGANLNYLVALEQGPELSVELPSGRGADMLDVGATVRVGWDADAAIVIADDAEAAR